MSEVKELAIGEEGVIDGVKVRCVEHESGTLDCPRCCFPMDECNRKRKCQGDVRKDKKEVYYQEVKMIRFSFRRYSNKLYLRIGSLIIEAGWYEGEPACCGIKALEWFQDVREVVIIHVQIIKAILCVSWDYGRR